MFPSKHNCCCILVAPVYNMMQACGLNSPQQIHCLSQFSLKGGKLFGKICPFHEQNYIFINRPYIFASLVGTTGLRVEGHR